MRHHTKDKGDSGLGYIIADLLSKGIQVALPISEHLPFDCIAISEDNRLVRLSVKYRKKSKVGCLDVALRSSWVDKNGNHFKHQNKSDFDATAIYSPETNDCYYIRNSEVTGSTITLRIDKPKQRARKSIRMACDFRNPNRLFTQSTESKGS